MTGIHAPSLCSSRRTLPIILSFFFFSFLFSTLKIQLMNVWTLKRCWCCFWYCFNATFKVCDGTLCALSFIHVQLIWWSRPMFKILKCRKLEQLHSIGLKMSRLLFAMFLVFIPPPQTFPPPPHLVSFSQRRTVYSKRRKPVFWVVLLLLFSFVLLARS